ncbi:WD repeat protein Crb3 [Schizosaccharomyces japonicus yFS275]|uniref:Pre-rRNA-processing protein IPI3 n=1 Tax=Schizosaccharomyces japonicus (strain yFS275 / FY16936) TaxID=402676 RepID=B6K5T6_SCHJY|nr:WD repeat protein Crb3 [Schizosaccharomyces japonicus yFS275]EEB08890.1 WD repeat protein Crb3 [Schizosaccharomyces japonicus yFS275]
MIEAILSGYEATQEEQSNVCAHNLHNGSLLSTFRQSSPYPNATCISRSYLLSAQKNKPQLNIHAFGKENLDQRIILPETVECLKCSPCGSWLVAGTKSGQLYLWSMLSGALLHFFRAHYEALTHLDFTDDGMILLSGSKDGEVNAWTMASLVDKSNQNNVGVNSSIKPYRKFSGHTRDITGLYCGKGPAVASRVFTTSRDNTVKIWDMSSGLLLTTIALPVSPICFCCDPAERVLYLGYEKGFITVPLFVNPNTKKDTSTENSAPYALGGNGKIVDGVEGEPFPSVQHTSAIQVLTLSFDGSLLISGDAEGTVLVWDVVSKQVLRKIVTFPKPVTFLQTTTESMQLPANLTPFPMLKRMVTEEGILSDLSVAIEDNGVEELMQLPDILEVGKEILSESTESGWRAKAEALELELKEARSLFLELKQVHQGLWEKYLKM